MTNDETKSVMAEILDEAERVSDQIEQRNIRRFGGNREVYESMKESKPLRMPRQLALVHAIRDIDDLFGDGYAREHPELLGTLLMSRATDSCAEGLTYIGASIDSKELPDTFNVSDSIKEFGECLCNTVAEGCERLAHALPDAQSFVGALESIADRGGE